jgi:hypothetical protein
VEPVMFNVKCKVKKYADEKEIEVCVTNDGYHYFCISFPTAKTWEVVRNILDCFYQKNTEETSENENIR